MSFTVTWKLTAERELAAIWVDAADRQSVADAANELDRRLRHDPLNEGESRSGGHRVTFVEPLGIAFHASEPDRIVSVVKV